MNSIAIIRKNILKQAISGELLPQNEQDEPASILLEKIRNEKERLVKEKVIKKQTNLSSIEESEIPYEAPMGWMWIRLGEVINLVSGQHVESANYNDKGVGIPYLTGPTDFGYRRTNITKWTEKPKVLVNEGDILITVKGSGLGKLNILSEDASIGRQLMAVQNIIMERNFLLYLLLVHNEEIQSKKVGVAIPGISREDILDIVVMLPPLEEQKRIIKKASTLLSLSDSLKEESEIQENYIQVLRQKVIKEAFYGSLVPQKEEETPARILMKEIEEEKERLVKEKITRKQPSLPPITVDEKPYELPAEWMWVRLGEIGDWGAGATPSRGNPKYYKDGTIPWLKTGELNNGYIRTFEEKITELALKETSVRLNKPGDVLVAMYGATIGKVGILEIEATTNQACCACTPYKGVYNKYLFYYLISQREFFQSQAEGGAQPNISRTKIINFLFPLPPLEEQKRIVEKIEKIKSLIEELEENRIQL